MAVVKALSLKDTNDQDVLYDIGADAVNIDYDNSTNVKTKIDNILEEIASLQEEYGEHFDALINSSEGIHGIRYYNNELQYYNGTEWQTISTNQTDVFVTQVMNGTDKSPLGYITNSKNVFSPFKITQLNFANGAVEDIDTNDGKIINVKSGGLVVAMNYGNLEDHRDLRSEYWDDHRCAGLFFKNGKYTTRWGEGGKSIIIDFDPDLVPWSSGSYSDICQMINRYYSEELSIVDIKSMWAVGDIRPIYDSDRENWVDFVIIDFLHDERTNDWTQEHPNRKKALITIQSKNVFMNTGKNPDTGTRSDCLFFKYSESSTASSPFWYNSKIRERLGYNGDILQSLKWVEEEGYFTFRTSVVTVKKNTATSETDGTIFETMDRGFLLSLIEVLGTNNYNPDDSSSPYSYENEGVQYEYYKIETNRFKKPIEIISGYSNYTAWGLRSPVATKSNFYFQIQGRLVPTSANYIDIIGTAQCNIGTVGLAPAFCL